VARRILSRPGSAWRAALALSAIGLVALAGCGAGENGDTDRGRQLFVSKCGTCHVLKEAATSGTQGPDLDAAFAQARASGMDPDTIAGVVKAQVESPRPSTSDPAVSMPAHLVTGEDLDDVATYVAQVAGVPGIEPPTFAGGPGGQVFGENGCGSCHTLKAAGSTGTTGPDLDKALAGQSAAEIQKSITDPDAKITSGYPPGVMPSTFGQSIDPKDLQTLIEFLQQGSKGQGK
jgi:mono/diheme cytochrome c family protein